MTRSGVPARREGVLRQKVSGGLLLLDPHTGLYTALDEVGGRFWELCDGSRTPAMIADLLCAEYNRSRAEAEADVTELLQDLVAESLVLVMR